MKARIPYFIKPLGEHHDRAAFSSGVEALDRYFRNQAGQKRRRHVAYCFATVRAADKQLADFTPFPLPVSFSTSCPRLSASVCRAIPMFRRLLGRLAVGLRHRGQGLGDFLLFDAMRRTLHADLAATVVLVDAKDEQAANFYRRHDFLEIGLDRTRLYLPVARIAKIAKIFS